MGIPVDSTLDFLEPLSAQPSAPATGSKLYFYSDGTLKSLIAGGSAQKTVQTLNQRGPAMWFTSETGTPLAPSNAGSPLNASYTSGAVSAGDNIVRESDGEVFSWSGTTVTDQGFTMAGSNAVTNTVARMSRLAAQTISATTLTQIQLDTINLDPGNNCSTSASHYTVPVAGYYRVNADVTLTVSATGTYTECEVVVSKNSGASIIAAGLSFNATESYVSLPVSDIVRLNAGDTLTLGVYSSQAGTTYNSAEFAPYLAVSLLAPLTNAPVSPNTAARAYRNAAFNIGASVWTKVPIDTVTEDHGGHMDVATNHRYNVASTGDYQVNCSASFVAPSGGTQSIAGIYKNGVLYSQGQQIWQPSGGGNQTCVVTDIVSCNAGDYLELWIYNSGSAPTLNVGSNAQNFISIVKVDQPVPNGGSNTGWFTPTLINSWTTYSTTPQYMKDANGFVHLRGDSHNGTAAATIFTLPAGYRPGIIVRAVSVAGTSTASVGVDVDTSGNVTIPNGAYGSFDCITFLAEN